MKGTKIKELLLQLPSSEQVLVNGWARSKRGNKNVAFIALNDGSTVENIQIVVNPADFENELTQVSTGACLQVEGVLVASGGSGQQVEIQATKLHVFGTSNPVSYPLQKKGHSLEFLREIAHLRPRTNTFGCVLRLRHAMAYAIHHFFHSKGFYYIHTPIITGSDCEGAGEMFRVTTLDLEKIPRKGSKIDFSQDFFGKETSLTVSGQLEGETAALALSEIYTFGPTFRAENSNTARHLSEFWMIEPEMAFYDLEDNMNLAEEFLKYLIRFAIEHNHSDLKFLEQQYDETLSSRLEFVLKSDFERITYNEAIELLLKSDNKFEYPCDWGKDLQSEHERYLVETHFKKPVIITDYPKGIKAFYMKQNDDGKTVRAMDVLFPGIGEIIGGSQREEDLGKLKGRINEMGLKESDFWWYLETRKYGTCPHSGFGLGFERLLLFITGMTNIRDVIPFPRTPKNAEF